jgi:hypothetical protein
VNQQPLTTHALVLPATDRRKPLRPGQHRVLAHTRVRITNVTSTTLGQVNATDAKAAGYRTLTAWRTTWLTTHDHPWLSREHRTLDEQLRRFTTRWAHQPCELVRYVQVQAPRLLADTRNGKGDYTTNPARCIDREAGAVVEPDPRYVQQARLSSIATRENFQADLEAERALRKAQRRPFHRAA